MVDSLSLSEQIQDPILPEEQAHFLLGEITEWMGIHRPAGIAGQSVWRPAFSGIAPAWAQLTDWVLELSTQLSVNFMASMPRDNLPQENSLDVLEREITQFKKDVQSSPSLTSRLMGRSSQDRQEDLRARSFKLLARQEEVIKQREHELAAVVGYSHLATLLVDASQLILDQAPGVIQEIVAACERTSQPTDNIFQQRANRRREENALMARGAIQQFLPRLEAELPQKKHIQEALRTLREQDQQRVMDLREQLSSAVLAAQQPAPLPVSADASSPVQPLLTAQPARRAFHLGRLLRAGDIPSVSRATAAALMRLRANAYPERNQSSLFWGEVNASGSLDAAVAKRSESAYAQDVLEVVSSPGLHQAWVPMEKGSPASVYALAMLLTDLGGPKSRLWTAAARVGLGEAIIKWSSEAGYELPFVDKDQLSASARSLRGVGEIYQVAFNLSQDAPLAAVHLLARGYPSMTGVGHYIATPNDPNQAKRSVCSWAREWLLSPAVEPLRQDRIWGLAVGRLAYEQMTSDFHGGVVLEKEEDAVAVAKSLPAVPPTIAAGLLASTLSRARGRNFTLEAMLRQWNNLSFAACDHEELAALDLLCRRVIQLEPATASSVGLSVAEWLAAPRRLPARPDLNLFPSLHAFHAAGQALARPSTDAVPALDLHAIAEHAPSLLYGVMWKRKLIGLQRGGVCSYEEQPGMWLEALPPFSSPDKAYNALPGSLKMLADRTGEVSHRAWEVCLRKKDWALVCALARGGWKEVPSEVRSIANKAWHTGEAPADMRYDWLNDSRQLFDWSKYPEKAEEFGPFLASALGKEYSPEALNSTLRPKDRMVGWLSGYVARALKEEHHEHAPAVFLEMMSRAMDQSLAKRKLHPDSAYLDGAERLALKRIEEGIAKALDAMDCSLWGVPPRAIAEIWRATYEEQWSARRREDMGDRLPPKDVDLCEAVFDAPQGFDAISAARSNGYCWLYETKALAADSLAHAFNTAKMKNIVCADGDIQHGVHLRFCVDTATQRQVIGMDCSLDISLQDSTPALVLSCKDRALKAESTLANLSTEVTIECLPYRRTPVQSQAFVGGEYAEAVAAALPQHRGAIPMAVFAEDRKCPPHELYPKSILVGIRPRTPQVLPLDVCIAPAVDLPLVRHPVWVGMHGDASARAYGRLARQESLDVLLGPADKSPIAKLMPQARHRVPPLR